MAKQLGAKMAMAENKHQHKQAKWEALQEYEKCKAAYKK
jgi:hypothetical protein